HVFSSHCLILFFFFFFSSRRRHTRFDCDWSSDVCSSDLFEKHRDKRSPTAPGRTAFSRNAARASARRQNTDEIHRRCDRACHQRSEERRVGKEWRSRWSREHWRKNK